MFGVCCWLFDARCVFFVGCSSLCVLAVCCLSCVHCMLYDVCSMLSDACCVMFVVCWLVCAARG